MFTEWKYLLNSHSFLHDQVIKMLILVVILFLLCWGPRWLYHQIVNFHHHLYPQVHHGDPAQDGDPAVHCYCLLDQVANHHIFYLITFFIYRVVLFLFPFIHAIGQVILIVRRLSYNCLFSVNPLIYVAMSKLFRNSLFKMMSELCCKMENHVDSNMVKEYRWQLLLPSLIVFIHF